METFLLFSVASILLIVTPGPGNILIAGAIYLIWLGVRAIRSQSFISFEKIEAVSTRSIVVSGFLTASLSPKIGVFMLAFIPQFISQNSTSVTVEMAVLGSWFALLTVIIFSLMGASAHLLAEWFKTRPRAVKMMNAGAGTTLIGSGVSLAFAQR